MRKNHREPLKIMSMHFLLYFYNTVVLPNFSIGLGLQHVNRAWKTVIFMLWSQTALESLFEQEPKQSLINDTVTYPKCVHCMSDRHLELCDLDAISLLCLNSLYPSSVRHVTDFGWLLDAFQLGVINDCNFCSNIDSIVSQIFLEQRKSYE